MMGAKKPVLPAWWHIWADWYMLLIRNSMKEAPMPEPVKRDPNAPKFLEISIKDSDGRLWSTIYAQTKDFSTGSVGYYASEKITNPLSAERYQCGFSFTLIGSKPGK
jgi:hypothetical protein